MAAGADPARPPKADAPLTRFQLVTMMLCILINVCDGLDTSATAVAAPAIIADWHIKASTLGLALSAGAAGLMLGALVIAPLADRFGRRTIILACTFIGAIAMIGIGFCNSVAALVLLRLLTGLSVGALVPSLTVMVIEYSNETRGNLFLALVHIGFALGAALGGALGAALLGSHGWRAIYLAAGLITGGVAIAATILLPESLQFLLARRPRNALARANVILRRLGRPVLDVLPLAGPDTKRPPIELAAIVQGPLRTATLLLWTASFMRYFVSYFLTGWKPQVLVIAGFKAQAAAAVSIATSFSASVGVLTMGLVARRLGPQRATAATFFLCAISLVSFGFVTAPIALVFFAMLSMFAAEAAFTGMMITSVRLYPDAVRGTGVGFTVGVGRLGAIAGPYIGGVAIGLGFAKSAYFPLYAAAAVIGGVAILLVGVAGRARFKRVAG